MSTSSDWMMERAVTLVDQSRVVGSVRHSSAVEAERDACGWSG